MKIPRDLLLELHFGQEDLDPGSVSFLAVWPESFHMLNLHNKYQHCRIFVQIIDVYKIFSLQ